MKEYQADFYGWTEEQAAPLKAGRFEQIDVEHLIAELESVGVREKARVGEQAGHIVDEPAQTAVPARTADPQLGTDPQNPAA